ncbi:hypothetical protein Prudu_011806 [Prunus dulcis]|uniref:Ankyrin repeat family protein n=1 Tax=Prunus dulcis TaxID=3755 RepID=A0A4Y1RBF3_PRUDU|nr:hypothetical protein Prudu_011806 [Prunus dulcis]
MKLVQNPDSADICCTAPASAATAPALMDHLAVGPAGSQAPASSTSSVAQPVSARRRHRPASTTDTTSTDASGSQPAKKNTRGPCRQLKMAKVTRVTNSHINIGYDERHRAAPTAELHSSLAHDIGHVIRSYCPMQWKSWKVMPDETKTAVRGQLSTNYNLEDLDEESLAYVNRLFSERYKQWKSNLHHHFQAPAFVNKAKVNKGNRKKKTLLHHWVPGPSPIGWMHGVRGGPIPRDRRLWRHDDGGEEPVGSSGVRLPTSSRYSDRVCGSSTGCWVSDLDRDIGSDSREETGDILSRDGNARRREPRPRSSAQSNSQVTALTVQVATLQSQMSVILQSLAQSGIPVPHFDAPTSEPVHPEHPQTSKPHVPDDNVDFGTLFD